LIFSLGTASDNTRCNKLAVPRELTKEQPRRVAELADFLDLTPNQARQQFRELRRRSPVASGRQVTFLPVETLLCLAASFLVNHRRFGGSTAHQAPEPVPTLARLFSRPPSSVLAKMANLDGSRSHGGQWDILAGAMLREDSARFTDIYRLLLRAARTEGIDRDRLPDFLDLEDRGEFALLGQAELGTSVFENALRDQIARSAAEGDWPERDTERIILAAARVRQHVFALNVLNNCGRRCVFCGLNHPRAWPGGCCWLATLSRGRTVPPPERLDPRNGLAACPSHDVAFDTRMLTVSADLKIHVAQPLADAARGDQLTRQYYGRPPLLETLLFPYHAQRPRRKYLDWHREKIFVA
jgi:putative restriction endonuclease